MKTVIRSMLVFTAIMLFMTLNLRADELRVGFSKIDITPSRPTPMAGYYHERLSNETHDPLYSHTTVLERGDKRIVLVSLDLISTTRWLVEETRRVLSEKSPVPLDGVMISSTHSHTGPILFDPDSSFSFARGDNSIQSERYMNDLPALLCDGVLKAIENMQTATIYSGIGQESHLAFNRRFFMKDGSVGWNPGKMNPQIVREAGPTDDFLPVISIRDAHSPSTKILGIMCNYSIHLDTVGGTAWSADMPYTLAKNLREVFGEDCHVQYTTGCCGDVNHIDVRNALPQKGAGEAARIGTRLAAAALKTIEASVQLESKSIGVSSEIVKLPLAEHEPEKVQWAQEIVNRANSGTLPPFMEMVEAFRVLDVQKRNGAPWEVEVQVMTLGDSVAWVSLPGEVFVQLGMAIKDGSPFSVTTVNELANGSIGYIPTQQAYPQGNYEVISARCAAGSGELLVDSALRQLNQLFKAQRVDD